MLSHPELVQICELAISQIREVLTVNHVSIQRYALATGEWQSQRATEEATISSFLSLNSDFIDSQVPAISGELELAALVEQRLRDLKMVSCTIVTKIGSLAVSGDCLLVPIACQHLLWGRICIIGSENCWQSQDLKWLQALSKLLGQSIFSIYQLQIPQMIRDQPPSDQITPIKDLDVESVAVLHTQLTELLNRDQAKDEFISKVSHDLRAPLMNMRMALKMLRINIERDPNLAEIFVNQRTLGYWNILEAECEREINLVNNVLDLQKIETDHAQLQMNSLDITDWLQTITEPFQARAESYQQKLELRLPNHPTPLVTDEACLNRVVSELLNNACKYTATGDSIICEVEYPAAEQMNQLSDSNNSSEFLSSATARQPLYLTISNQAVVAATDLPHLFDRFYRVPAADRRKQGGTGLGLSLVRNLVEKLHGQITVQSRGGWTTFTVALPLIPPD
jgi:signal transduction histidine kinase